MDLKEFVKETLVQITEGVSTAQDQVRLLGGYVNPASTSQPKQTDMDHLSTIGDGQNVFLVNFDVAVSSSEEKIGEGNAKLKVASFINIGAEGGKGTSNSTTNRISFKIPLALPVDHESLNKLKERKEKQQRQVDQLNRNLR